MPCCGHGFFAWNSRPKSLAGIQCVGFLLLLFTVCFVLVNKEQLNQLTIKPAQGEANETPRPKSNDVIVTQARITRRKDTRNRTYILQWRRPWGVATEGWNDGVGIGDDCVVTTDRSKLKDAAAVVFHYSALDGEIMPWQHYRDPDQLFIFYAMESPPFIRHYEKRRHFHKFDDFINWTMTYRRDADVFFSYLRTESLRNFVERRHDLRQIIGTKSNVAIWVVSKCNSTRGNTLRWEYVQAMIKAGLPLHGYGDCFQNRKGYARMSPDVSSSYKFYLAFENVAHCKDYVSEKFWYHGVLRWRVPVVFGAKKAELLRLVPPRSFIHTDDFPSPAALTKYLLYLHDHDDAYLEYFKWIQDVGRHLQGVLKQYLPNRRELLCRMVISNQERNAVRNVTSFMYDTEHKECLLA